MGTTHSCDKAPRIAVIEKQVNDIDKILNGNGKKGLRDEVTYLSEVTGELRKSVDEFKTVVSGMNKYMAIQDERYEVQLRKNTNLKWALSALITLAMILYGTGILKPKETVYIPINGQTINSRTGQTFDSAYWNDEDNPVMRLPMN